MDVESTTWFDQLPTEIIFHIFDYLSNNQIIYTFFYFSQRLNILLLQNKHYVNNFQLPTTNINLWKTILSVIGSEIECLYISTIHLTFSLSYFRNLKSVSICSSPAFPDEELKSIIDSDQFNNLHTLKIKQENNFFDISYYNYSFNQNSLLIFPFSLSPN